MSEAYLEFPDGSKVPIVPIDQSLFTEAPAIPSIDAALRTATIGQTFRLTTQKEPRIHVYVQVTKIEPSE